MTETIFVPGFRGYKVSEYFDRDGGVISLPVTGVMTTLITIQEAKPVYLAGIVLAVFDPAAIPLIVWQLLINGSLRFPWANQRMLAAPGVLTYATTIQHAFAGTDRIDLQAAIPAGGAGPFDAVGKVQGASLRQG